MALNYQFLSNVTDNVRKEIERRQGAYWPNGTINNDALSWNYQKTAYIILTALQVTPPSTTTQLIDSTERAREQEYIKEGIRPDIARSRAAGYTYLATKVEPVEVPGKVTEISSIPIPTLPILKLYGSDYTNSTGTLRGAILNSAEITSDGSVGKYGSILRITVNFTVFDRDELDLYMDNFLRPGRDIGLEFGWSVNEDISVNKGNIRGTVFNFSFSAKEDGSWDCSLNAYGASAMTYGFPIDAKDSGTENASGVDKTNFATYGLLDIVQNAIDKGSTLFDSSKSITVTRFCQKIDISKVMSTTFDVESLSQLPMTMNLNPDFIGPQDTGIPIYLYRLPSQYIPSIAEESTSLVTSGGTTAGSGQTYYRQAEDSKITYNIIPYISLDNLINLINSKINKISKRGLPTYTFKKNGIDICVGNNYHRTFLKTGPADSSKFGFTTQVNGQGGSGYSVLALNNTGEPGDFSKTTSTIPIQHLVLVNVMFIRDELQKIISSDKNVQNKKITSFLNILFAQLLTETGGIIDLEIVADKTVNGEGYRIFILNKNGMPDKVMESIDVFPIPMMTKGSVVRSMNIESKVPDAIVTEVATFTRSGLSYGSNEVNVTDSENAKKELLIQLDNLNKSYIDNLAGITDQSIASIREWRNKVRNIYKRLYSIQENLTLNTNGGIGGINNILDLKTAVFPIYMKLTLDGINGFLYGNAITTNWLPKQYRDSRIYWTVTKIRHLIQNNDWITELETIYKVKES
jgi:hypothetical protein